jgi:hypothetical protein
MCRMSYGIGPHKYVGLKKKLYIVVLVNKAYKMKDCGLSNGYCSIVNNFFRWFIIYCYTIVLSNGEACDRNYLVYQTFFYISEKMIIF